MAWTDEQRAEAKELYENANPTAENSTEIVKDIAETLGQTANGTRMILIKAEVYIKASGGKATPASGSSTDKPKRISKADSAKALIAALKAQAIELQSEELAAIDRATGKMNQLIKSWIDTIVGDDEEETDD